MAAAVNFRIPDPLRVNGSNVADDWRRFREQYENYEIVSDRADKSQEKRAAVFSERELTFTFAICCRPSVCLSSVCRLSVTLVHPTQAVQVFGNICTAFGTLAIH